MLKKILSKFGTSNRIAVVAIIIAILVVVVDFNFEQDKISGYLCNIATELASIVITYFVIQKLLDSQKEKEEKKHEKSIILRYNKLISIYIYDYKKYFYCIITPIEKRDFKNININHKFEIRDMCDLHQPSLLITSPLNKSSIELFYIYEQALQRVFENFINNNNFKYYKNVQEVIIKYIQASLINNVRDAILSNEKMNLGNEPAKKFINEMLKSDYIEDHYKKFKENTLGANTATPYFILFELLKLEINIINEYENIIKNIIEDVVKEHMV